MINVAAIRMQQFGVQFYQASLTASDIDKLVRFEVLNYGDSGQGVRGSKSKAATSPSKVNWDLLERRIASSEKAYQRHIIRRRLTNSCSTTSSAARRATCRPFRAPSSSVATKNSRFVASGDDGRVGMLKVPEREGILRAIDGQHRLLALHADIERFAGEEFTVPAIIFDRLPEDHVVQMFVTINAKHTRLNASHLVSLSGRQLYRDDALATAHDVVRALNDREDSPLHSEIKLLGVGHGRVAQAPLAQELKKLVATDIFNSKPIRRSARGSQEVLRELLQADSGRLRNSLERPQVQHPLRVGAARVRARRAGRAAASRPGARRTGRFPRHRPGDLALGAPHRRSPVRDRWRLETQRHDGGVADQRAQTRAAIPEGASWV